MKLDIWDLINVKIKDSLKREVQVYDQFPAVLVGPRDRVHLAVLRTPLLWHLKVQCVRFSWKGSTGELLFSLQ